MKFAALAVVLCGLILGSGCSGAGSSSSSSTIPPAPTQSTIRFVEAAPLLEEDVGGVPIGLGTSYLMVDGATIASLFEYGTITQCANYSAASHTIAVFDSLGYSVGPFKTPALAAGKSYSIALVGEYPRYSLLTFEESGTGSGAGLRVYEASPSEPAVDFGSFIASSTSGFAKLGSVRLGSVAEVSLGAKVTNFGAYVGKGTTPISGGSVTLQSVNSFDGRNELPFHNASVLSLFVFDVSPGALAGPVFGVLDR